jgi:hypothetical protein
MFLNHAIKIEPIETCWSNMYQLKYTFDDHIDADSYKYSSSNDYHVHSDHSFLSRDYNYFLDYIQTKQETKSPVLLESLFIAKCETRYLFRSVFVKVENVKNDEYLLVKHLQEKLVDFPLRSNIEFVFVEYKNPFMIHEIELKIPKEYYVVHNEMFSPAFVLRMLEQQPEYFVFDMHYTLSIMDHQINRILIHADQYILINESSYEIKFINVDNVFPVFEEKEDEEDEEEKEENKEDEEEDEMYSGLPFAFEYLSSFFYRDHED